MAIMHTAPASAEIAMVTFRPSRSAIHPPIAYAKLASMAQGAEIASRERWG
jgi:hypothetical protein